MTTTPALAADAAPDTPTDTAWENPPRSPAPTGAPVLSAAGVEGPLDWLLEMARAQKIDLAKLPIAALIGSFVAALDAALDRRAGGAFDLARWGDWLVMAATLTQLRSRLLLPPDATEAKAALSEAEALRRQLVLGQRCRQRQTGSSSGLSSGGNSSRGGGRRSVWAREAPISPTCCVPA